jgi:putative redox protein
MTSPTPKPAPSAQATVRGDVSDNATLSSRARSLDFPLGGCAAFGGIQGGPNPYDLLSASLAACTAMTMRLHARHKGYPLSHVEAAVSYHHGSDGGRSYFERAIVLRGDLDAAQRSELLRGALCCPVAKTLEAGTYIDTKLADNALLQSEGANANYLEDLFSIVNIDPD